jgi:secondary thiamine-phosphate synthase enzyme
MGDDGAMTTMLSQRDGLKVLTQTLAVSSAARREALDITADVRDGVRCAGIHNGLVIANCLHTTCSVLVAESGPVLLDDFVRVMGRWIDDGRPYRHNDPRLSDCERGNATAHLRASLLGHGVALGVTDGELLLGRSESILLAEWDGPRVRRVHVQIMGV